MRFLLNHKDNDGSCKPKNRTSESFLYWRVPLPAQNLIILAPPRKINPTKHQFSSCNPIKTAFLAVGIAPALDFY